MTKKEPAGQPKLLHHRFAFFAISTLLLFVVVLLPFTVSSAFQDILGPSCSVLYPIPSGARPLDSEIRGCINIVISSLDELDRLLTMRVYMRNDFADEVDWKGRLILFAVYATGENERLPPSVTIDFPYSEFSTTQVVQLPVRGRPLRYPFDDYDLCLGIVMQKVYKDGRIEYVTPENARKHMAIQITEHLPRQCMHTPVDMDPQKIQGPNNKTKYLYVENISFTRPLYLKVISVLLVLLVAAAASYAVFMRPLSELLVNSGALVLGVWGIRAILVAGSSSFVTAVDIALATVILFLLTAISVRSLDFFKTQGEVNLPGWGPRPDSPGAGQPQTHESDTPVD